MKSKFLIAALVLLSLENSYARRGEHDGNGHDDDGSIISCIDLNTNGQILEFQSTTGQGSTSTSEFDLAVKSKGDDISEVIIVTKPEAANLRVKRLEELLKMTLTESPQSTPVTSEVPSHRGEATLSVVGANGLMQASAHSQSRHRTSVMEVELKPASASTKTTHIRCQRAR